MLLSVSCSWMSTVYMVWYCNLSMHCIVREKLLKSKAILFDYVMMHSSTLTRLLLYSINFLWHQTWKTHLELLLSAFGVNYLKVYHILVHYWYTIHWLICYRRERTLMKCWLMYKLSHAPPSGHHVHTLADWVEHHYLLMSKPHISCSMDQFTAFK